MKDREYKQRIDHIRYIKLATDRYMALIKLASVILGHMTCEEKRHVNFTITLED